MRSAKKERLENKLKLWDTPGFSQFLNDLATYMDNEELLRFANIMRHRYIADLNKEEQKNLKYKQGRLL